MTDLSPTRAALLELQDEQHAMREGYVFLDEKCLLQAGEVLRQLGRHAVLERALRAAHAQAMQSLQAAIARHGLEGLQVEPAPVLGEAPLQCSTGTLMGVRQQDAHWGADAPAPAAPPSVAPSPELRDGRPAFAALIAAAAPLAAVHGNLERLSHECRRSVRRARALQDVMLPEAERAIADVQGRIEELEQQDAIWMRRSAAPADGASR